VPFRRGGCFLSHWDSYAPHWDKVSAPLRPTKEVAEAIAALADPGLRPVLQLGVTPELAAQFDRLDMVDRSRGMIASLWPGDTPSRRAICADWFDAAVPNGHYRAVVGDGSLNALDSRTALERFLKRVADLLEPEGRFVCRVFARPSPTFSIDDLTAVASGSRSLNFGAFKWMLAMNRVEEGDMAIATARLRARFDAMFPNRTALATATGWPLAQIDTIDVYRGSKDIYIFPSRTELIAATPHGFNMTFHECGGYDLSECCPLLVMERSD